MSRIILLLLFLVAFGSGCCSNLANTPLTGPQLSKMEDNASVALVHKSKEDGKVHVYCSGVFVGKSTIITDKHCVDGLADMINEENAPDNPVNIFSNIYSQGFVLPEQVVPLGLGVQFSLASEITNPGQEPAGVHLSIATALYVDHDIAILSVVNPGSIKHGIARLADSAPEKGENITITGNTKGFYFTFIRGTVSAYRDDLSSKMDLDGLKGPFMQVDSSMYFGNSGCGAFNNNGELVGLADFISNSPNLGFFTHLESIRAILIGQGVIKGTIDTKAADPELN